MALADDAPREVVEGDDDAPWLVEVVPVGVGRVVAVPLTLAVWVKLGVPDAVRTCDPVAVGVSVGEAEKLLPGDCACD